MFLLLHIFETAIRSKAVVQFSNKYSTSNQDDWLYDKGLTPNKLKSPLAEAIKKIRQDGENKTNFDSFEIFDYIMLGQLKAIYIDFWSNLSYLFDEKSKNEDLLPKIGKNKMKNLLDEIRKARNDNAHHKPFHKTRRRHQIIENIELILTHIGYNLNDAINKIVKLRYI